MPIFAVRNRGLPLISRWAANIALPESRPKRLELNRLVNMRRDDTSTIGRQAEDLAATLLVERGFRAHDGVRSCNIAITCR